MPIQTTSDCGSETTEMYGFAVALRCVNIIHKSNQTLTANFLHQSLNSLNVHWDEAVLAPILLVKLICNVWGNTRWVQFLAILTDNMTVEPFFLEVKVGLDGGRP